MSGGREKRFLDLTKLSHQETYFIAIGALLEKGYVLREAYEEVVDTISNSQPTRVYNKRPEKFNDKASWRQPAEPEPQYRLVYTLQKRNNANVIILQRDECDMTVAVRTVSEQEKQRNSKQPNSTMQEIEEINDDDKNVVGLCITANEAAVVRISNNDPNNPISIQNVPSTTNVDTNKIALARKKLHRQGDILDRAVAYQASAPDRLKRIGIVGACTIVGAVIGGLLGLGIGALIGAAAGAFLGGAIALGDAASSDTSAVPQPTQSSKSFLQLQAKSAAHLPQHGEKFTYAKNLMHAHRNNEVLSLKKDGKDDFDISEDDKSDECDKSSSQGEDAGFRRRFF